MTFHVGQIIPLERTRRPFGAKCALRWFIFTTPPQMEIGASAWLELTGATEVWFPTETIRVPCVGKAGWINRERMIAPGYVFAAVEREVAWDVLFEMAGRRLSSVVSSGEWPLAIPEKSILAMRHVPKRLEAVKKRAVEAEALAKIARTPQAGDQAHVMRGIFEGRTVDIRDIHRGIALCVLDGMEIKFDQNLLEKQVKCGKGD